jgi:hypothetical protein
MTPQLANQFATLAVKLFVLVVLPILVFYVRQVLQQAVSHITNTQAQTFVANLVNWAEAQIAAPGAEKYQQVLNAAKLQFPQLDVAVLGPMIESEVVKLHQQLGTFTPAKAPAAPAPAPLPVLDTAAVKTALTTGLSSLVPASLTGQLADMIASAFTAGVTTADKATSPVVEAPVAPDRAEAGTPVIVLPAGVVAPVTEPTPLT